MTLSEKAKQLFKIEEPFAITMWEFSWIERRWPGAGYEDWPLLNWGWILELNHLGVTTAAKTGCWAGIATSNFCGPQFAGMWREKLWHKELTDLIKHSKMI